jgi:hypothetical protein
MPAKNEWQTRFGAARRITDRRLLAEVERLIILEERAKPAGDRPFQDNSQERAAIARAFGRPVH